MLTLREIYRQKISTSPVAGKKITAVMVCDAFNKALKEIFGEEILKEANAISFKEGNLKVKANSSVLAQEIKGHWGELMNKEEIKKMIFEIRKD